VTIAALPVVVANALVFSAAAWTILRARRLRTFPPLDASPDSV
jgi:hypothetical protein